MDYTAHNWLAHLVNQKYAERVAPYSRGRLLDLGCGEKPYFDVFKHRVDSYIGLEHPMTLHKNDKIDLFGDACNLPFADESFDTVVSFQVMEHIPEPDKMIAEVNRVLVTGGHAIFTTPFMWGIHEAPNDYYRFTKYGLRYLFEKNGFEIRELLANTGFWAMAGLRLNYYLARFAHGFVRYAFIPIFLIVQVLAQTLDKIDKVESDTAGYVVVSKKV
jgi:SAM-dependent methyltransferase